jgi:hypothetical protein
LLTAIAGACTVPVFRFALDRWVADKFLLEVPGDWFDSDAGKAFEEELRESKINFELSASDVADGKARISYPQGAEFVLWEGDLEPESIVALANSPAREKVADLISSGESGVWVVVPGKDETKNAEFKKRLSERIEFLETVGEIPEQDLSDPDNHLAPGPELRVGFEMFEVKRDDPVESLFVKMLASPDGEELLASGEPFAAAVYGRGRVLGVWAADDLDDEGIDEVSLFLLGACSCRVKAQNPGWDLLMGVDWDEKLMAAAMAADLKKGAPDAGAKKESE